jgi:hypothetical protein
MSETSDEQEIHRNDSIIWFFRKRPDGRLVPAMEGQGYSRKEAPRMLAQLQVGDMDGCDGHHPAGDHYIPTIICYVKTEL